MSTTHHASTSTARSATTRFATTLGLAIALFASPAAQARATLSTGAAPAALAQPQHAPEGSGIAQRQQASESKVLPAPFLVAPNCPDCRGRGGQGARIDDVRPAFENKALPAPFLVAPGCPNCRPRGGQAARIDDVFPAFENKALPAPFLVAPGCPNCRPRGGQAARIDDVLPAFEGFGFNLLAGGDPPTVVDSWGWPRPRG